MDFNLVKVLLFVEILFNKIISRWIGSRVEVGQDPHSNTVEIFGIPSKSLLGSSSELQNTSSDTTTFRLIGCEVYEFFCLLALVPVCEYSGTV